MTLGESIKIARKNAGLTQAQLAEKCGFAPVTIQQYESGKREPRMNKLAIIAHVLDVDIVDFVKCLSDMPIGFDLWDDYGMGSFDDLVSNFSADNRIKAALQKMNVAGRLKAAEHVEELALIPKYQRDYNSEPPAELEKT